MPRCVTGEEGAAPSLLRLSHLVVLSWMTWDMGSVVASGDERDGGRGAWETPTL